MLKSSDVQKGFLLLLLACLPQWCLAQASNARLTAAEVMHRVIAATGAATPADTVDTVKAGDPETVVTGIATTFMDTYAVLEAAVAAHKNLIITHEPTFYNHEDDQSTLAGDAVQAEKLAYIREHHLVVWRFHDTWHLRKPDGILEGMMSELGWKQYQSRADAHLFTLPSTTVAQLAQSLQMKTGAHAVRIVGDPKMRVTQVALLPGASGLTKQVAMLRREDVQVLVAGESREWETVEYAQDAAAEGRKKALILLGHEPSEEAGMQYCAEWLKSVLPQMPIQFISAGDPFATPSPAGKDFHRQ